MQTAFNSKLLATTPGYKRREEERRGGEGAWRYRSFHLAAAVPGLPEEAFSPHGRHVHDTCIIQRATVQYHTPRASSGSLLLISYSLPLLDSCQSSPNTLLHHTNSYSTPSAIPSTRRLLPAPPPAVAAPLRSAALARSARWRATAPFWANPLPLLPSPPTGDSYTLKSSSPALRRLLSASAYRIFLDSAPTLPP